MLELDDRWIWDFWHVLDGGTHHLFFLSAPRSLGDPDLRHWNVAIGHATSPVLRDWTVHDDVLGPGEAGAFDDRTTWTGSVVRDGGGGWVMAYTGTSSVEDAKVQRIGIARSDDLFTWNRQTDGVLAVDSGHYEQLDPEVWFDEAWRDPWLFRHDGRWHCFVTARANEGAPRDRGVIGHAVSDDLRSWEVLPPVSALREVSQTVALAVALQAHKEGLAKDVPIDEVEARIQAKVWTPRYVPYRRTGGNAT